MSFRLPTYVENLYLLGTADFTGHGNAEVNNIIGNSGDNRLAGLNGNDTIAGDLGDDRILGGNLNELLDGGDCADTLTGGTGADTFVFAGLSQTGPKPTVADILADFTPGDDLIDLSALDAITNNANPNVAFTFLTGAFTGVAGQLHAVQIGGNTYLEMDVNGDTVADATIRLNGLLTLTAADFVL